MILLITKYNLSPKWFQFLIVLIFYFILIQFYYVDFNDGIVECAPKKNVYLNLDKKPTGTRYLNLHELPEDYSVYNYMKDGVKVDKECKVLPNDRALGDHRINRMMEVIADHDKKLRPLIAEEKSTASREVLRDVEALDVSPDLSNLVTMDRFQQLETRVNNFINNQQLALPNQTSTQEIEYTDHIADITQLQKNIQELEKKIELLKDNIENKSNDGTYSLQELSHEEQLQRSRERGERCGVWIDGCISKITCTIS